MKISRVWAVTMAVAGVVLGAGGRVSAADHWDLAQGKKNVHRFSTLITAQDVRSHLATDRGIDAAQQWCRQTGVTKVYVESYRDGDRAPRDLLAHARDRFRAAGFDVSGCITTTRLGKRSTGWNGIACFTDPVNQDRLRDNFEYAAGLFDEIMIDDFWFTDCTCPQCDAARHAQTVTIGDRTFPVAGASWADYRGELMLRLSQERILAPSKRVNPRVRIIIKYPQWYDQFHERGYDVARETAVFDRTWVGTETRDYRDHQWGGTPQYEGFFLMRWLGGLGGAKCGGGWFDPYGTTPRTYIEQARQTILGGARESVLFCYGSLLHETGPANIAALRAELPELLAAAEQVQRRRIVGVAAYKPPGSSPGYERRVFDFVGMMGVPLAPCHEFPAAARAAFFSVHAMKDPDLAVKLAAFVASGKPVLITDGLAKRLEGTVALAAKNIRILPVKGDPKSLLDLPQDTINALREPLLEPFSRRFKAPNRVGLYLFDDSSWVVENFNDEPVTVQLDGLPLRLEGRAWQLHWNPPDGSAPGAARP